jgi:hypothetical protein
VLLLVVQCATLKTTGSLEGFYIVFPYINYRNVNARVYNQTPYVFSS